MIQVCVCVCVCVYTFFLTLFFHLHQETLYFLFASWKIDGGKMETVADFIFFSSVTQSCPTLCDPMDCSTPGFPVHHQLLELALTHVHRVRDAIQLSHSLLSFSPPQFSWAPQLVQTMMAVMKLKDACSFKEKL